MILVNYIILLDPDDGTPDNGIYASLRQARLTGSTGLNIYDFEACARSPSFLEIMNLRSMKVYLFAALNIFVFRKSALFIPSFCGYEYLILGNIRIPVICILLLFIFFLHYAVT